MPEVIQHRSSHVSQTVYHQAEETLEVTFSDGRTYQYQGVPRGTYTRLITSPSVGKAFHILIRGRFDGEEV